jgi:predicted HD superfamily hydrolase involved in NAD metabolism
MEYGIDITKSECTSPYLLHAKLGAYYVEHVYHISDTSICSAVRYHTTGRAQMSKLEEIVFIADYIEPYRNQAKDLERIRCIAFQDIEQAVYEVTKSTLNYLSRKGRPIDPATEDTFQYYRELVNSKSNV